MPAETTDAESVKAAVVTAFLGRRRTMRAADAIHGSQRHADRDRRRRKRRYSRRAGLTRDRIGKVERSPCLEMMVSSAARLA
jgi:hypothetical protein